MNQSYENHIHSNVLPFHSLFISLNTFKYHKKLLIEICVLGYAAYRHVDIKHFCFHSGAFHLLFMSLFKKSFASYFIICANNKLIVK